MVIIQQTKTISVKNIRNIQYPAPYGWRTAAGILKGKKYINPVKYQKEIRREWNKRIEKQTAKTILSK